MVESNADTLLKSKATQQSNETEANPYNAKKDYIDYEQREANAKEPFADANTIAVKNTLHFNIVKFKIITAPKFIYCL